MKKRFERDTLLVQECERCLGLLPPPVIVYILSI